MFGRHVFVGIGQGGGAHVVCCLVAGLTCAFGGRRVHCGQGVWTLALLGPFPCSGALSLGGRCIGKFACY